MPMVQQVPTAKSPFRSRGFFTMTPNDIGLDAARAAMLGGVLYGASDPMAAATALAAWISEGTRIDPVHRLEPQLAETARRILDGLAPSEIRSACLVGAAWVLGYRSAPERPGWEPVISQPPTLDLPLGLSRTTGETIVGIITHAHSRLAIASPFIDKEAIDILTPSLLAAGQRGVAVTLLTQRRDARSNAIDALTRSFERDRLVARLKVEHASGAHGWPHLKVIVADANEAYIGSANLTGNALMGRNFEFGVLLRGDLSSVGAV